MKRTFLAVLSVSLLIAPSAIEPNGWELGETMRAPGDNAVPVRGIATALPPGVALTVSIAVLAPLGAIGANLMVTVPILYEGTCCGGWPCPPGGGAKAAIAEAPPAPSNPTTARHKVATLRTGLLMKVFKAGDIS